MFGNESYCGKIAFSDDYNIDFNKSFPILDDSDITASSNTSYIGYTVGPLNQS